MQSAMRVMQAQSSSLSTMRGSQQEWLTSGESSQKRPRQRHSHLMSRDDDAAPFSSPEVIRLDMSTCRSPALWHVICMSHKGRSAHQQHTLPHAVALVWHWCVGTTAMMEREQY